MKQVPIADKRGCDREPLSLILVRSDVNSVSKVFTEYFELEVYKNSHLQQYLQLEKNAYRLHSELQQDSRKKSRKARHANTLIYFPTPVWRYHGHEWSIVYLRGENDDIAFAFSTLLETDVITFWDSKYCCCSEFKLFRGDRFIEHYRFGLESQAFCDNENYWDLIVECETDWQQELEDHKFCSAIRQVEAEKIRQTVNSKRALLHEYGFLDGCLKYHNAYLPTYQDLPWENSEQNESGDRSWQNSVEQMNIVMKSNYWAYYDRDVPQLVARDPAHTNKTFFDKYLKMRSPSSHP